MPSTPTFVHPQTPNSEQFPVVRDYQIRTDNERRVSLKDLWVAAGSNPSRRPAEWRRSAQAKRLVEELARQTIGKSHSLETPLIVTAAGRDGGTFAHPVLAIAFAEFVDDRLAIEIREMFIRHRLADPTLADDILQRASQAANVWAGQRALARAGRHHFTDVLKEHGAEGRDYSACTDTLYLALFGKRAKALKAERSLPANGNLRDSMTSLELASVATGEALAGERISEEACQGGEECRLATGRSAGFVRRAIEADRMDRKGRVPRAANDDNSQDSAA